MTTTSIAPKIDHQMAQSILDKLGYTLQDLSLEYGDVVIGDNDISHQLYYGSHYSNVNIVGYVRIDNGIYYTHHNNHKTAEQAALELIPSNLVESARREIEAHMSSAIEYAQEK